MTGVEVALVILASGYAAGGGYDRLKRAVADRRPAGEKELAGPEPVCGCGHHLAHHDARDGLCYASVRNGKADGDGADTDTPEKAPPRAASAGSTRAPSRWPRCTPPS